MKGSFRNSCDVFQLCLFFYSLFLMGAVFYAAPTRNDKNWVREVLKLAPRNLGFDEIILWATNLPVPLAPSVLLRQTNNHLRLILFTQTHHPENCFFILILHPVVIVVCHFVSNSCHPFLMIWACTWICCSFCYYSLALFWPDLVWCYLFLFNFGIV